MRADSAGLEVRDVFVGFLQGEQLLSIYLDFEERARRRERACRWVKNVRTLPRKVHGSRLRIPRDRGGPPFRHGRRMKLDVSSLNGPVDQLANLGPVTPLD